MIMYNWLLNYKTLIKFYIFSFSKLNSKIFAKSKFKFWPLLFVLFAHNFSKASSF